MYPAAVGPGEAPEGAGSPPGVAGRGAGGVAGWRGVCRTPMGRPAAACSKNQLG